ncbi:heterotrimeric G protein alpha subunit C [Schizophyllum amplum]|uniref:Guanine nucleotide-binding protein subunit alpha n=1 Tax=Schizophyllum amplum TaxID=97359 RepID=A0A550CHL2_9AGAR|nr:heterotrimeric G protein alpha subunit C [Auriculariopsis ampla]
MGVCISSSSQPVLDLAAKERSEEIDTQLKTDGEKLKKECKILLLGSGESGKSTIVKQMKIIHQDGFTPSELASYRPTIYRNVIDSAQAVAQTIKKAGSNCADPSNCALLDKIIAHDAAGVVTPDLADAIRRIWKDPVTPKVIDEHANTFYLMDNAAYFFENVIRIGAEKYLPTETDVLRARVKTTSISETRFACGPLTIHMFDVGGQRSERKKWIHCFESVTSIIFCTALSEYDQVLLEEKNQNRMAESLTLFESVINSRWFLRTSVILFLNKTDVFKIKLPKIPLDRYFPEYTGGDDINKAAKFILWKFMQANRARLSVYPHLTQATDTKNVRHVFAAVKETILHNALRDSGIL